MSKLILMRGVSGGGKSTLARQLAAQYAGAVIYSTDDYFIVEGVYKFELSQLGLNHSLNQHRVEQAMADGVPCIIVDNTNLQAWEMKPYVEAAIKFAYDVEFQELPTISLEELMERQQARIAIGKALSADIIQRMLSRYEPAMTVDKVLASQPPNRS
jgi:predicted kinase